jgi:hypothetical protein
VFVQRLLYALLAPIARMRGYRARSTNEEA